MRVLLLLVLLALLAGCGDEAADDEAANDEAADDEAANDEPPEPGDTSLTGTLDGDPHLEGGCVWLEVGADRYEILWPEGYEAEADPVRLLRDGQVVAEAGDQVTVEGAEAEDMVSVCQVGPVFDAARVQVAGP